jgi:Ca-activated chloride channel homolog
MLCSRRIHFLLVVLGLATSVLTLGAQSSDDLPAAPSATRAESEKKAAPPPPAPKRPPDPGPASSPADDPASAASTDPSDNPQDARATSDAAPDSVEQPDATFRTTVNEVSVVFTVTDKHNHYVKELGEKDFKVLDDEKPVEKFRSFRRETDLPLQVGLLIDASNSIRERFKFEQESAIEFLSQVVRPRYDRAFVLGFDVTPEITQDFTDSSEALAKGVRSLKPGGGTAMYDALYFACRDKLLKSTQTRSVRRAVILVTDGDDNSSHVTREEAIDMALRANVIVYTISTNFPGGGDSDKYDKVLDRIADATGGRAFKPFQLSEVANAFAQIQDDLRSQYALSYLPPDFVHDGRYRTIAITALHKGLKVRTRPGYYAPSE